MRRWMWFAGVAVAGGVGIWYASHRPRSCESHCGGLVEPPAAPSMIEPTVAQESAELLPMPREETTVAVESDELIDLTPLMKPIDVAVVPASATSPAIPEPKFEPAPRPTIDVPEFLPHGIEDVPTLTWRDWWERVTAKFTGRQANPMRSKGVFQPASRAMPHEGCTFDGRGYANPVKSDARQAAAVTPASWWFLPTKPKP